MKNHKIILRLLRSHRAKLLLPAGAAFIMLSSSVVAVNIASITSSTKPNTVQPKVTVQPRSSSPQSTPSKASTSAPKPASPAPTPTPKPAATQSTTTPAPKPAADVTQSPTAVANTSTTPGNGVSGLSSSSGGPAPVAPSPLATASPTATATSTPCSNAPGQYASTNWAGYFKTGCIFTAVSGRWTVPTSTTTSTTDTTVDATWIGIGGVTTDDLIQVGTEETVDTDGTINAAVFYELLPDAPHYPATIAVSAGDQMSASLVETIKGSWLISITDLTNGMSYAKTVAYSSSYSSAEWVEEDPSFTDGTLVPFDNFGTVTFTGTGSTGNGISGNLSDASSITLVNDQGHALASPTAVTGAGSDSFSVKRQLP